MNTALTIAQIAATVFVGATFVVYLLQLRVMRSASEAQSLLALVAYLQDAEVRAARRLVITKLESKRFESWSPSERNSASTVASSYDIAAILVRLGLVKDELFLDNWGPSITRCYKALEPLIADHRHLMGPRYWDDFSWLYKKVQRLYPVLPPASSPNEGDISE